MHKVATACFVLAWLIIAGVLCFAVAPMVETKLFPPYSTFTLLTAEQTPDGTIATFRFVKNRSCAPKGLTWYIGEVGDSTSIDTAAPNGTRAPRPLGEQTTSPYLFPNISVDVLKSDMVAVLRNQCTFPFTSIPLPWITVSWVYP